MKHTSLVIIFLLLVISVCIIAQDKAQVKQEAETKLKTMSPVEIDAKIKEAGMTREQATQKAKEYGVSLEDFMSKQGAEFPKAGEQEIPKEMTPEETQKKVDISKKPVQEIITIPGFSGRTGISPVVQPYGYNIFQYPATTFEPVINVATPPTYLLGVGDEVVVTVWGETRLNYTLVINKEGNVVVPDVGPVGAIGNTIQQLREKLLKRMSAVYSGLRNGAADASTSMDISLGKLKTLQVFVLGEVIRPGGYSLSSLSTIMHALYLSGGPTVGGSLREVQLKRDGKVFRTLDVYDYLTKADNSKDVRLQDGDIILIKPVGKRVALLGNLFRPGIYELRPTEKLKDVIAIAGGMLFDTYFNRVHIVRIIPFEQRTSYQKNVMDIDIRFQAIDDLIKSATELQDGDIVSFYKINDFFQNRVSINGNVKKPGVYELKDGMKVKDLIVKSDSLIWVTFSRGFIFRILANQRREIIPFDPNKAFEEDPAHNFPLENEDEVIVYKTSLFYPTRYIDIAGEVRKPGRYPRDENMTLSDLIVLAGGLTENAYVDSIEISRLDTLSIKDYMIAKKVAITKSYWENGNGLSTLLADLDFIFIPHDPKISDVRLITINGLVKFPGVYPLSFGGERLADIIDRAGGLMEGAYLEGSSYTRKGKAAGKISLDLKKAYEDRQSNDNVLVNGGDSIFIWWRDDIIYMTGEFYVPRPVLYKRGASIEYYISQAGGLTDDANGSAVSAYYPNGKKWEPNWSFIPDPDILPGSVIIAPKKIDKPDTVMPYIRDIVTILASLATITVGVIAITRLK